MWPGWRHSNDTVLPRQPVYASFELKSHRKRLEELIQSDLLECTLHPEYQLITALLMSLVVEGIDHQQIWQYHIFSTKRSKYFCTSCRQEQVNRSFSIQEKKGRKETFLKKVIALQDLSTRVLAILGGFTLIKQFREDKPLETHVLYNRFQGPPSLRRHTRRGNDSFKMSTSIYFRRLTMD